MARVLKTKELENTRLATNYGGWMYCENCGENIGYLCYSTYDKLQLKYQCNCGKKGKVLLEFVDSCDGSNNNNDLIIIKNRLCCPLSNDPLITLLDKKLLSYNMDITCKECSNIYNKKK